MHRSPPDDSRPSDHTPDEGQGERLLSDYVDRLIRGEDVDFDKILEEHPHTGREIIEQLELFRDIGSSLKSDPGSGVLGDFELRRRIGRGGMGVVYEAWEKSLERRVALKVLRPAMPGDTKALTRFVREAQLAAKLHHSNIVQVYGMGLKGEIPYFTMLTGQSPRTFPRS